MKLTYMNPTKTLIIAQLDAGETLGTLGEGTGYIKVDGTDPNYVELLKTDPQLETVVDPGEVKMPPPAEAPPTAEEPPVPPADAPAPAEPPPEDPEPPAHRSAHHKK